MASKQFYQCCYPIFAIILVTIYISGFYAVGRAVEYCVYIPKLEQEQGPFWLLIFVCYLSTTWLVWKISTKCRRKEYEAIPADEYENA